MEIWVCSVSVFFQPKTTQNLSLRFKKYIIYIFLLFGKKKRKPDFQKTFD